jgi:diacylglycerol kinase (ATP)
MTHRVIGTAVALFPWMRNIVQILVTPGSGDGRALGTARRLQKLLRRRGYGTSIQKFSDVTTLAAWARTCKPAFTYLIGVGGDATQSAAAAASARCGVPFLPVPTGFGNIFARVFRHSAQGKEVAQLLERGELHKVDVGMIDDELFLSHRSYGLLQQIQDAAEAGRRRPRVRFLRHLWYYASAMRVLKEMAWPSMHVEIDGKEVATAAVLVTVANVETYRGFLSLTPQASPLDGRFDVFVIAGVGKLRLLYRLLKLRLRLPGRWKRVGLYRGRRVVVTIDGRREELRTVRHALPVLVAPGVIAELKRRQAEDDAPLEEVA